MKENKKGIVYCAINKINDKRYIGETSQTFIKRKNQHKAASKLNNVNTYFYNAIKKYGFNNFEWIILEDHIQIDDLLRKEANWIIKENTLAPNGYNLIYSLDNKYILSEETKKKLSQSHKGKNNYFYGKTHNDETKNNHSNYNQHSYYFKNKLTNKEFKGKVFEFCKKFNIPTVNINTIKLRKEKNSKINYFYKGWSIYDTEEVMLYWLNRDNPKKIVSDETKQKISLANKGKSHSLTDATKKKISSSNKGKSKSKNSSRYDQHIYIFKHRLTLNEFRGKVYEFCEEQGFNISDFNKTKRDYFNSAYKNWNIFTDENSMKTVLTDKYLTFKTKDNTEYVGSILGFCHKYKFNKNAIQVLKNKQLKNKIVTYSYKGWSIIF